MCGKLNAQRNDYKKLSDFLTDQKLYDYGYGLEKYDTRLDSIVCYNDLVSELILFKELQDKIQFNKNDSIFKVNLNIKKNVLNSISIDYKNHRIKNFNINDSLNNFTRVVNVYDFIFQDTNYILFYLSGDNIVQSLRENYLGILIDTKTKLLTPFPTLQNTCSLLPLTDIDKDGKLDYISYAPSFRDNVKVYSLNNDSSWTSKKNYFCKLFNSDGFVWQIDFQNDNFLKRFYDLNK